MPVITQPEEVEAEVQGHPQLHNEFKVSMGYMGLCITKKKKSGSRDKHTYNPSIWWRRPKNYEFKRVQDQPNHIQKMLLASVITNIKS